MNTFEFWFVNAGLVIMAGCTLYVFWDLILAMLYRDRRQDIELQTRKHMQALGKLAEKEAKLTLAEFKLDMRRRE